MQSVLNIFIAFVELLLKPTVTLSGNYLYTMERSKNLTGILKKFQHICSVLRFFRDTLNLQTQCRAHH